MFDVILRNMDHYDDDHDEGFIFGLTVFFCERSCRAMRVQNPHITATINYHQNKIIRKRGSYHPEPLLIYQEQAGQFCANVGFLAPNLWI